MGRLAEDLLMQGRLAEAEEAFDGALLNVEGALDALQVYCGYARLIVVSNRASRAAAVAAEIERLLLDDSTVPISSWGYAWLSQLHLLAGKVDESMAAATRAVDAAQATGRGYPEAFSALSAAQEKQGDLDAALDSIEQAMVHIRSPRCLMEARAEHARLSLARGDIQTAVRSLTRAVQLPDLKDRHVLASVMSIIARVGETDAVAAVRLVETLAVHLSRSIS